MRIRCFCLVIVGLIYLITFTLAFCNLRFFLVGVALRNGLLLISCSLGLSLLLKIFINVCISPFLISCCDPGVAVQILEVVYFCL